MEQFTKSEIETLRREINEALKPLEEKFNVSFKLGNIHYTDKEFSSKLNCNVGTRDSFRKIHFERYCRNYGLRPEHFGKILFLQGKPLKIVGIRTSARKYPIICEKDGQEYVYTKETIKYLLSKED